MTLSQQWHNHRKILAILIVVVLAVPIVGVSLYQVGYINGAKAQTSSITTNTLTGGTTPGAPTYTVYLDSGTYYAKNQWGANSYSGAVATTIITDAINALDVGRTNAETVKIIGSFSITAMIYIPSYTTIDLTEAKLSATSALTGSSNYVFFIQNAQSSSIMGGVIDCGGYCNGIAVVDSSADTLISQTTILTANPLGITISRSGEGITTYPIRTTMSHNVIRNSVNNAIYIFHSQGYDKVEDNLLDTITSGGTGHSLFLTDNCFNHSQAVGNTMLNSPEHSFYIGGGDYGLVAQNHIINATHVGLRYDYGSGVVITDNTVENCEYGYHGAVAASNRTITNNVFSGITARGLSFYQQSGVYFSGITLTGNIISSSSYDILASDLENSVISNNIMSSTITSNYAVLFGNADGMGNNIFSNNQVISSGFGVEMTYGGNNTITCNTIAASQGYAIVVTSSWTMVENNKVSGDGSGDGILINGDAHFSIIGNTANDFADGIHVVSGPYGKVVANTCINNGVGYELEADNTIMASNDFISNTTPTSLHGHSTVAQLP